MRHKKIRDVTPFIYKSRQRVAFILQGRDRPVYLTPENIEQNTGVTIDRVEILIGSAMRVEFYAAGETMALNGTICDVNDLVVKDFWITPSGNIEDMAARCPKRTDLKRIRRVFTFFRKDRVNVGFDIGEDRAVFTAASSLQALTGIQPEDFDILVGSYIDPKYFQEGEITWGGQVCRKSNVLLKDLGLRLSGKVEEMMRNREDVYVDFRRDDTFDWYSLDDAYFDAGGGQEWSDPTQF